MSYFQSLSCEHDKVCEEDIYGFCYHCGKNMLKDKNSRSENVRGV